ncbi:MAG TPA: PadR family transcriptional regulator [Vicinamibacterales bacterium]
MKGDRLGEFEELTLLAVCAIKGDVYGVPVQQFVEKATGRAVTMGAIYAALARLEDKGFVRSMLGEPVQMRGGKRKRLFEATAEGIRTVKAIRRVRERIWRVIESGSTL